MIQTFKQAHKILIHHITPRRVVRIHTHSSSSQKASDVWKHFAEKRPNDFQRVLFATISNIEIGVVTYIEDYPHWTNGLQIWSAKEYPYWTELPIHPKEMK